MSRGVATASKLQVAGKVHCQGTCLARNTYLRWATRRYCESLFLSSFTLFNNLPKPSFSLERHTDEFLRGLRLYASYETAGKRTHGRRLHALPSPSCSIPATPLQQHQHSVCLSIRRR